MPRRTLALPAVLLLTVLAACGSGGEEQDTSAGDSYPVRVRNCGAEVSFDTAPERVVMLKSSAVPYLHTLGVLDHVVARAGEYPAEYYDQQTLAELDEIPVLTDELDTSGHLQISREAVVGQNPDLVLGEVDNLPRASLEAVGTPLLEEPAMCGEGIADPGFDDIYSQLEMYGKVFDRSDRATRAVADLKERVADLRDRAVGEGRTAAVLYPTVGGGTTFAYGTKSMAHPQLEAAGFDNVFADVDERVFEVTLEQILDHDPDVIVLLHSEGKPGPVKQALTDLPGADRLTAVRNGDVMTQLFNFTEPPTALTVDGLERIIERFEQ